MTTFYKNSGFEYFVLYFVSPCARCGASRHFDQATLHLHVQFCSCSEFDFSLSKKFYRSLRKNETCPIINTQKLYPILFITILLIPDFSASIQNTWGTMGVPEGPGFDKESSDDVGFQATLTDQQVSLNIFFFYGAFYWPNFIFSVV